MKSFPRTAAPETAITLKPLPSLWNQTQRLGTREVSILVAILIGSWASATNAQSTWQPTAAGIYSWNSNGNWSSGTFPNAAGEIATWGNITGAQTAQLNQNVTVGELTLGDSTSTFFAVSIEPGSLSTATLNFDHTAGNAVLTSRGGANSITSAVNLIDTVNMTTNTTLLLSGAISGSGGILKNGTLNLTLSGTNTFSGGITASSGRININSAGALGTGTLVMDGGALDNTSGAPITVSTNNSIALNTNVTFAGTNSLNLGTGSFSLGASNRTISVTDAAATLTIGGVVSGTGALTKAQGGSLLLTGASNYTGATTVNSGTLMISGSLGNTNTTVNGTNGGRFILSGNGTTGTGTVSINSGAVLGASDSAVNATIGGTTAIASGGFLGTLNSTADRLNFSGATASVLNISGAVAASSSASLIFQLGATGINDSFQLTNASGSLNIGSGTLNWDDFSFSTLAGFTGVGTYTLFDTGAAIVGTLGSTLSGAIGGSTGTLSILNGQDLILTVVPEPSTWALLTTGLVATILLRRRRSRR